MKFTLIAKKLTGALIAAVTLFSATAYLADDNNNAETVSAATTHYSVLSSGETLNSGDYLQNGNYKAKMNSDGNFVVYKAVTKSGKKVDEAIWATRTGSANTYSKCWASMQTDGNFVVYANRKSTGEKVVLYNAATDSTVKADKYIGYSLRLSSTGTLKVVKSTPSGTTVLREITAASGGALTWPVPSSTRLKSSYTETIGRKKQHRALDIGAKDKMGNPAIVSALAGTVKYICTNGYGGGYGNYVVIEHTYYYNGIKGKCVTKYNHLNSVEVKVGQVVSNGQLIGYMGSTGNSDGIHLDFQFFKQKYYGMNINRVAASSGADATPTDPLPYMKWPKGVHNDCTAIKDKDSCEECRTYFSKIKARFVKF